MMRGLLVLSLLGGLMTSGCREESSPAKDMTQIGDGSTSSDDGGTSSGDGSVVTPSTIALMRAAGPGTYQLDGIVGYARTPSNASPKLLAQDAAGGDLSAILMNCSSTSQAHPCTEGDKIKALDFPRIVNVKGLYLKTSAAKGMSEIFYIESLTDVGPATEPTRATVPLATIQRSAWALTPTMTNPARLKAFQRVSIDLGGGTLNFYDMSPPECTTDSTSCNSFPYQTCFGMHVGEAGSNVCTNKTDQPASTGTVDAEILIGTDFYSGFKVSADCRCAGGHSNKMPSPTSTLTSLQGVLFMDVADDASTPFFYVAPETGTGAGTDCPLSNTVDAP